MKRGGLMSDELDEIAKGMRTFDRRMLQS